MAEYTRPFADGKAKVHAVRQKWSNPWLVALALELGGHQNGSGVTTVLCPWHRETNASCKLKSTDDGVFIHCFGCGRSGDVIDIAAAKLGKTTQGRDFAEVIDYLDQLQVPIGEFEPVSPTQSKQVRPVNDLEFAVIAEVIGDRCPIGEQADVADYLRQRRLLDAAIQAGWSALPGNDDALEDLVDDLVATVGERKWLRSGLSLPDGQLSFPWHKLVIPWRNPLGYVVNLQRRLIEDARDSPKYVTAANRPFPWPYGVERVLDASADAEFMLVEGAVDTLAVNMLLLDDAHPRLVLGIPGAGGWRSEWRFLCAGRRVVLAFDGDDAGAKARDKIARDLHGVASHVRGTKPPAPFKDWAELLQADEGTS